MNYSFDHSPVLIVVWQRFGAYHLARLRGAADSLTPQGWRTVGLEVAGRDEYEWNTTSEDDVQRRTLCSDTDYNLLSSREIRRKVAEMLDEIQPDAVAINGWSVPEARAAATWCRRNRRLAILMSETFESSAQWWKEQVKRRRVRRFDAALVGGRWHADYLVSLGFPRNKIHVGYDAVDNAHFYAETSVRPSTHATETSKLQLPARYFFANTRFLPRKNIDGLLHAYSQYRADVRKKDAVCEPWHLVISGSGEMENAWKTLAMELGLSATVHWPGFLQYDELPFYYSNASAFVHVAHREAWGLVVNEAAAAGLPLIVGNRVGSTCELVRDGINGILVDSTDTAQLSKALLRIATLGDERRRAMGRVSRRLADAYGPERFGTACAKILGDRVCTP